MHSILLVALLCSGDQTLEEWFRDFSQDVQIIGYKRTSRDLPGEKASKAESNSSEDGEEGNSGEGSAFSGRSKWLRYSVEKGFEPLFSHKQMEMLRDGIRMSLRPESDTLALVARAKSITSLFLMEGGKLRMLVGFESRGGLEPLLKLEDGKEGKNWKKALRKGALRWSEDGKRVILIHKKMVAWIDVQSGENNLIELKDTEVREATRVLAYQPGAKPLMWNKKNIYAVNNDGSVQIQPVQANSTVKGLFGQKVRVGPKHTRRDRPLKMTRYQKGKYLRYFDYVIDEQGSTVVTIKFKEGMDIASHAPVLVGTLLKKNKLAFYDLEKKTVIKEIAMPFTPTLIERLVVSDNGEWAFTHEFDQENGFREHIVGYHNNGKLGTLVLPPDFATEDDEILFAVEDKLFVKAPTGLVVLSVGKEPYKIDFPPGFRRMNLVIYKAGEYLYNYFDPTWAYREGEIGIGISIPIK